MPPSMGLKSGKIELPFVVLCWHDMQSVGAVLHDFPTKRAERRDNPSENSDWLAEPFF